MRSAPPPLTSQGPERLSIALRPEIPARAGATSVANDAATARTLERCFGRVDELPVQTISDRELRNNLLWNERKGEAVLAAERL